MYTSNIRLFAYSSLAIAGLALVWGAREIPRHAALGEQQLGESLAHEVRVLGSAVKSASSAMRYRLLDVLKQEDATLVNTPFVGAALLHFENQQWNIGWWSSAAKESFSDKQLREWMRAWPLAKMSGEDAFYAKVGEIQGSPQFAVVTRVRRASSSVPLLAVGIFPAAQFGVELGDDERREARVFDSEGLALALPRPAYLGTSLKVDPIVSEVLENGTLSSALRWSTERGTPMLGQAERVGGTNLAAAVEAKRFDTGGWYLGAWLYLSFCAIGAAAVNWFLFTRLVGPLFDRLADLERDLGGRRRVVDPAPQKSERRYELDDLDFLPGPTPRPTGMVAPSNETLNVRPARDLPPAPTVAALNEPTPAGTPLTKIVGAALRALEPRLENVDVVKHGLDAVYVETDVLALQTAIEEVLKNALEAMKDAPTRELRFKVQMLSRRVRLSIEDTGEGVRPEYVNKVFEPFFTTRMPAEAPRGLGLNVVRRVIEEMQGTIALRNRNDRNGVIVELDWPKVKDSQIKIESSAPPAPEMVSMPPREVPDVHIRKPVVRAPTRSAD